MMTITSFTIGFFAGCCQFSVMFAWEIKKKLHYLTHKMRSISKKSSGEIHIELKNILDDIIRFHSGAKEFSCFIKIKLNIYIIQTYLYVD